MSSPVRQKNSLPLSARQAAVDIYSLPFPAGEFCDRQDRRQEHRREDSKGGPGHPCGRGTCTPERIEAGGWAARSGIRPRRRRPGGFLRAFSFTAFGSGRGEGREIEAVSVRTRVVRRGEGRTVRRREGTEAETAAAGHGWHSASGTAASGHGGHPAAGAAAVSGAASAGVHHAHVGQGQGTGVHQGGAVSPLSLGGGGDRSVQLSPDALAADGAVTLQGFHRLVELVHGIEAVGVCFHIRADQGGNPGDFFLQPAAFDNFGNKLAVGFMILLQGLFIAEDPGNQGPVADAAAGDGGVDRAVDGGGGVAAGPS